MDFSFIKSNRFWCLVALAVVGVLEGMGVIDPNVALQLKTLLGGFIVVRTLDRGAEKMGGK